jgi:hypothetical protein
MNRTQSRGENRSPSVRSVRGHGGHDTHLTILVQYVVLSFDSTLVWVFISKLFPSSQSGKPEFIL